MKSNAFPNQLNFLNHRSRRPPQTLRSPESCPRLSLSAAPSLQLVHERLLHRQSPRSLALSLSLRIESSMASSGVASPLAEGLSSRNKTSTKQDKQTKESTKSLDFAHSFPIHTKATASILSKDSTEGLSFRGFGNLARESSPRLPR
jgi:hypothetical protein